MTRFTFTVKGIDELRFEYDSNSDIEDTVDEDAVTALLETALARLEQAAPPPAHRHTPLAEVQAARKPAQRMQGSGSKVPGLESVPCATCGAEVGQSCRSGSGAAYYPGWGHQARISIVAPDRRHHR